MILKGARIISPADNIDEVLDIQIENGIIVYIAPNMDGQGIDFSGKIIVPGLVDMHCHLREPGFEYKETIETGIYSAIEGGFVAISPMANTNPVVDNIDTLKFIIKRANDIIGSSFVYPICAVTKGLESTELTDFVLLKKGGAIAFSNDGKPIEDVKTLKDALLTGELIISHAESVSSERVDTLQVAKDTSYECDGEATCVARELNVLRAVSETLPVKLHFAHLSTKSAIDLVRNAKIEGLSVTCETAPHYFSFTKDDVTLCGRYKMNPPLASKEDLEAVIEGLKDGTIDCIATDHAPHSLEEKTKPFEESPFGIVGFETALSAGITNLVGKGHLTMAQLIEKMSVNPAKILGLNDYGHIQAGKPANLTVIDSGYEWTVNEKEFKSKCKISPFNGGKYKGKAVATVANGKLYKTGAVLCKH